MACGVYSILGAMSYAELGCMIPKTGGEYEYFKIAFGDIFGFLFVWTMTFIYNPASTAIAALTFSDYLLQIFFTSCDLPLGARICLAAAAISKLLSLIIIWQIAKSTANKEQIVIWRNILLTLRYITLLYIKLIDVI